MKTDVYARRKKIIAFIAALSFLQAMLLTAAAENKEDPPAAYAASGIKNAVSSVKIPEKENHLRLAQIKKPAISLKPDSAGNEAADENPENIPEEEKPAETDSMETNAAEPEEEAAAPVPSSAGLVIDPNTDPSLASYAAGLYALVPENVKNLIAANGGTVLVTPSPDLTDGHAGRTYAYDYFGEPKACAVIYAGTKGKVDLAVLHETGHLLDSILSKSLGGATGVYYAGSWHSGIGEFPQIFSEECPQAGYPDYNSTDPVEYFAETFRQYCTNPDAAKQRAPRACAYLEALLAGI